jgi:CHRD domain
MDWPVQGNRKIGEGFMRKAALVLGLLAVAGWTTAHAEVVLYQADISGVVEVPPVATAAKGSAHINADTATKQLTWRVDYAGLSGPATAAHIHCGADPGANAGVAVPLGAAPNLASPIQGSGVMTDAQFAQLQAGKCYVNIHSDANKGGEIRGQISK